MEIRKAKKADIDSIEKIYERIHDGEICSVETSCEGSRNHGASWSGS